GRELTERACALRAAREVRLGLGLLGGGELPVEELGQARAPRVGSGLGHGWSSMGPSCARRRSRARCSWDLLVPIAIARRAAISSCARPSTSCRTKTVRAP